MKDNPSFEEEIVLVKHCVIALTKERFKQKRNLVPTVSEGRPWERD